MFQYLRLVGPVCLYGLLALTLLRPLQALAASAAEIDREVDAAVQTLYNSAPVAPTLVAQARGLLVFPKVVKGGFLVGGEYGEGALRLGGQTVGYYNIAAVSYGLQAGLQDFGYALVFMTDAALQYLDRSEGFEVGVGPSLVVVDEGVAKTLTTTEEKGLGVGRLDDGRRGTVALRAFTPCRNTPSIACGPAYG